MERDLLIINIVDMQADFKTPKETIGGVEYEGFIREGAADFESNFPRDEWDAIALGYT